MAWVLCLEDRDRAVSLSAQVLADAGISISQAPDAEGMLSELRRTRYDAVMLPAHHPIRHELARDPVLRRLPLIVTEVPDDAQVAEALAAGPVFLVRGASPESIVGSIRSVLREQELAQSRKNLEALFRAAERLARAMTVNEVVQTALEGALDLHGVEAG